jgi:hypothetical protein
MKLKMQLLTICLISLVSYHVKSQVSPHVISFFVRPLPASPRTSLTKGNEEQTVSLAADEIVQKIVNQGRSLPFLRAGLYASYAGTITHSNADGQILFERKSPEPTLLVIITDTIKPIPLDPLKPKTVLGFTIDPKMPAEQYSFKRVQDPETELYTWHVTSVPLDRNSPIPYDTIIIYADPRSIIVPVGSTVTTYNENFFLPDFYVTEGYNSALNGLRFLKIRHFFAPVSFNYIFLPDQFQKKITKE